jgi:hypothetical protein
VAIASLPFVFSSASVFVNLYKLGFGSSVFLFGEFSQFGDHKENQ